MFLLPLSEHRYHLNRHQLLSGPSCTSRSDETVGAEKEAEACLESAIAILMEGALFSGGVPGRKRKRPRPARAADRPPKHFALAPWTTPKALFNPVHTQMRKVPWTAPKDRIKNGAKGVDMLGELQMLLGRVIEWKEPQRALKCYIAAHMCAPSSPEANFRKYFILRGHSKINRAYFDELVQHILVGQARVELFTAPF
jgi:hypothetical protein